MAGWKALGRGAGWLLLCGWAVVALGSCGLVPTAVRAGGRPARFEISPVPAVAQLDYSGCGAAALAMVFGRWGAPVEYMEIVDVARSMAHGTSLPDMVRGAHFSRLSAAVSEAYPACQPAHGYSGRGLGYGGFHHASREPWLDGLEDVVAQGCPVAVLTDWKPGEAGPHYRVVTGYDDEAGVVFVEDPWPYGKSLEGYRRPGRTGWAWPKADFLAVWSLSTEKWGLPGGFRYGAVLAVPWTVRLEAPSSVAPGRSFTVGVRAEYRCPAPFGRGPEPTFPRFPASGVEIALEAGPGLSMVGPSTMAVGVVGAGEVTPRASFTLCAPATPSAPLRVTAIASGHVSGRVPKWGTTYWNPPYTYTDLIGGEASTTVTVR